jgi:hypothetical protein
MKTTREKFENSRVRFDSSNMNLFIYIQLWWL